MDTLFGPVMDVFELSGRGCIVAIANERISADVRLHIGDAVVLKSPADRQIKTTVRGLDFGHGKTNFVGVLVGPEISKEMIGAGAELWKSASA
jgi:hypothetical protein